MKLRKMINNPYDENDELTTAEMIQKEIANIAMLYSAYVIFETIEAILEKNKGENTDESETKEAKK